MRGMPTVAASGADQEEQIVVDRMAIGAAIRAELTGRVRLAQAALLLLAIGLWELLGLALGSYYLPTPVEVVHAGGRDIASGVFFATVGQSLRTLVIGYGIAVGVGIALGFIMGWYRWVGRVLDPVINGLYVVPTTALVPLIIVWFGLGITARVVSIFLFAVFQILVSTYTGVRNRDELLIEAARAFGARGIRLFRKVVFFDALPHIFAGLRLGISQAIKGMVIAEFLFAATGIGGQIVNAADRYQTDQMFVYIIATVLLGISLAGGVQFIERILVRGRP